MALVNETYFKFPIDIDYSKATVVEKLGYISDYCEDFYLKKLLGNIEYYKYVDDKALEVHDTRYTNFLTAANFTYELKTYKNDIKQMIAYFIYFDYVQESAAFNTPIGEFSSNVENSTKVIPSGKLVRAWNSAVDLYNIAYLYLLNNIDLFPDLENEEIEKINVWGI